MGRYNTDDTHIRYLRTRGGEAPEGPYRDLGGPCTTTITFISTGGSPYPVSPLRSYMDYLESLFLVVRSGDLEVRLANIRSAPFPGPPQRSNDIVSRDVMEELY